MLPTGALGVTEILSERVGSAARFIVEPFVTPCSTVPAGAVTNAADNVTDGVGTVPPSRIARILAGVAF